MVVLSILVSSLEGCHFLKDKMNILKFNVRLYAVIFKSCGNRINVSLKRRSVSCRIWTLNWNTIAYTVHNNLFLLNLCHYIRLYSTSPHYFHQISNFVALLWWLNLSWHRLTAYMVQWANLLFEFRQGFSSIWITRNNHFACRNNRITN